MPGSSEARLDRVVGMMTMLVQEKRVTGARLAGRFGVTVRTVYRDMELIMAAGAPVSGVAGEGYTWNDNAHAAASQK
jgi:predicted DNA-binding transcriptional regulator YafY